MDSRVTEQVLSELCAGATLRKLDVLCRDLTGVGLLVAWSCGDSACGQIPVGDSERHLPQFCQLLHGVPQGLRRCVTCHSLIALAARSRGVVTQGRCHGGTCVVAAPATGMGLPPEAEVVVISTCSFTLADRKQGWRITRRIARDLGLDLTALRHAYESLPRLRQDKLKIVGEILETAAAALTEALRARGALLAAGGPKPGGIKERLHSALQATREPAMRNAGGSAQATLVDVVISVVGANPQLPVTVADISQAAHVTPNHFSLLFHRQTGTTFTEFLAEKRFERAQERLRDLTLSIAQVARQAGYSDPNYFAKVFHKRAGMSPRQWRLTRCRRRKG